MAETQVKDAMESLQRIAALQRVVDQKAGERDAAETRVKSLRREEEKALLALQEAIREEMEPTLFSPGIAVTEEQVEEAKAKIAEETEETEEAPAPKAEKPKRKKREKVVPVPAEEVVVEIPADGEWRKLPVSALGLDADGIKAMADHDPPLYSVGDLAEFIVDHRLTDVKGVSKKMAARLEDAMFQLIRQGEAKKSA